DVGHPRRQRRSGGIDERKIVERAGSVVVAAEGQVGGRRRRGQRKIVSTIAAPSNVLEPEVAAFGALHGIRRSPFSPFVGALAVTDESVSSWRWMSPRKRSASAFCGSV